jgi:O-antigen/teichoic acid export membrane protein
VASAGVLLMSHLLEAFTGAIKPAVSDLDARHDTARVKEIAFLTQKYSLLLIIPATFFFVAMGGEFLRVWVGSKFPDAGAIDMMWTVLAILSVGHCLRVAQHSNFLVLVGLGEHRVFGVLTALAALICVSASTISVKVFNLGLVGIAWSNFLPMVLISGVVLPIYFNWKMRISAAESVRDVWLPALLGSLPAVAVIGVWKYVMPPASWLEIMAVVVVTTGVTVAGSWFLGLKAIERRRFAAILRSKG